MTTVQPREIPANALLYKYSGGQGFADCYVMEIPGLVSQQDYVMAFYTSPLFKIERTLLQVLASAPATDSDAAQLAAGKASRFSAWRVEEQTASQLLLADVTGQTRSWLMATAGAGSTSGATTLLYFGSAVLPRRSRGTEAPSMGWLFHALSGFHRIYSRLLLKAASRNLRGQID